MKKFHLPIFAFFLVISLNVFSQSEWPRVIKLDNGNTITMYQPQPEKLTGNLLITREVVSVKKDKNTEPVFGVVWTAAKLLTDKDTRMATLLEIKVTDLKFPDVKDSARIQALTTILESEMPKWELVVPLDEIVATLEEDQPNSTDELNTKAPEVIYKSEPTTLILIDGDPIIKKDEKLKMERVFNTPFLIVKSPDDKKFYLYAGKLWYSSASLASGWAAVTALSGMMKTLDTEIKKQEKEAQDKETQTTVPAATAILVSTKPAELIQTKGEAQFSSVEKTGLLYVTNTTDEIFKNVEDQQYYILLSGRWYKAVTLKGPWSFIASDKLPADFSKIPEGSDKDAVLANVAGTDAAHEAVMDAQIPQTAKVDINSTDCNITYDGEPKFEPVEGTNLSVAVNTSGTVLLADKKYYAVENGVWFVSTQARGPWKVSTERPADVSKIPPDNQAYNTKYVYIYETTPQYVYVGYTPGYMGCYVYGPTVVYGTGYYYYPWYGAMYYPRPVTWGFGMHYNPWTGWGMGICYSTGYFHMTVGFGGYGGWWGPPVYRPPFYPGYGHHYGGGNVYVNHNTNININNSHNNNIYNKRRDVSTRDINRGNNTSRNPSVSTRDNPSNRVSAGNAQNKGTGNTTQNRSTSNRTANSPKPTNRASNNVYSDKSGNVYQKGSSGDWQQRNNGSWQSSSGNRQSSATQMNRSSQQRDRGNMRSTQATQNRSSAGGGARTGGGGARGGRR